MKTNSITLRSVPSYAESQATALPRLRYQSISPMWDKIERVEDLDDMEMFKLIFARSPA